MFVWPNINLQIPVKWHVWPWRITKLILGMKHQNTCDNTLFSLQLGSGGWRRPLTMGYQTSETHEKFRNEPDTIPVGQFTPNPQGFLLSNHHTNGPSKVHVQDQQILHSNIEHKAAKQAKIAFFCFMALCSLIFAANSAHNRKSQIERETILSERQSDRQWTGSIPNREQQSLQSFYAKGITGLRKKGRPDVLGMRRIPQSLGPWIATQVSKKEQRKWKKYAQLSGNCGFLRRLWNLFTMSWHWLFQSLAETHGASETAAHERYDGL